LPKTCFGAIIPVGTQEKLSIKTNTAVGKEKPLLTF